MEKEPRHAASTRNFHRRFPKLYKKDIDDVDRFERGRPLPEALLADTDLKERGENWPARNDPARGHFENLLFYEDPDYGFVLNALIKEPGESTLIHDHGVVLTVYGVLIGGETIRHYRRVDSGAGEGGEPGSDDGIELETRRRSRSYPRLYPVRAARRHPR